MELTCILCLSTLNVLNVLYDYMMSILFISYIVYTSVRGKGLYKVRSENSHLKTNKVA